MVFCFKVVCCLITYCYVHFLLLLFTARWAPTITGGVRRRYNNLAVVFYREINIYIVIALARALSIYIYIYIYIYICIQDIYIYIYIYML